MRQIVLFIKSSLKELNPWQNIKILHTNIRDDIIAGITVAIIALPLALAFGEISQLGPIAGIWGAIAGGIIGGLFGGCLVGVSGPTAPKAAQIAAFMSFFVIGTTNQPDLVAAFSIIFLSGLILVAISLLKISRFINYIPYSVIAGFMCGIGVIVIITQINPFIGLQAEKNIHDIFKNFEYTINNINTEALFVAFPSLLILFLWSSLEKKIKFLVNIPSPLMALIVGTSIAYFMGLNIPYIGDKMNNSHTDKIFSFYLPDLNRISEFIIPAFALAVLAVLDSLLSCKVADNMIRKRHSSDRETFGQGMANMTAGLFGGVTTATATMRTVANIKFGAKTPLASIVHGLTLLAILLGLGFLVAAIPAACLAAILFKVGIDILDYRIIPILRKIPITDLLIFIIVLFITVYQDLMVAVLVGVSIAFFKSINEIYTSLKLSNKHKIISFSNSNFVLKGINKKELDQMPINVLQPYGSLFFGTTESLINLYSTLTKHEMLIVDLSHVVSIDLTGVFVLEDLIDRSKDNNIKVFVTGALPNINKVLQKINFIDNIGKDYYKNSEKSIIEIISSKYKSKSNI